MFSTNDCTTLWKDYEALPSVVNGKSTMAGVLSDICKTSNFFCISPIDFSWNRINMSKAGVV